MSDYSEIPEIV